MRKMKDDDACEMIQGLLQRTRLMKKIAEHGNAGRPRMFEISRHYKVKRFLFTVDITFYPQVLLSVTTKRSNIHIYTRLTASFPGQLG